MRHSYANICASWWYASVGFDQRQASLLRKCYTTLVPVLKRIINQSLATYEMPDELKTAVLLIPLKRKKRQMLFRGFGELQTCIQPHVCVKINWKDRFLNQSNDYFTNNDLHVTLQSAYKVFHSTETSSLRVHNDIVLAWTKGRTYSSLAHLP